jgi:hypothetical protein
MNVQNIICIGILMKRYPHRAKDTTQLDTESCLFAQQRQMDDFGEDEGP